MKKRIHVLGRLQAVASNGLFAILFQDSPSWAVAGILGLAVFDTNKPLKRYRPAMEYIGRCFSNRGLGSLSGYLDETGLGQ